MTTPLIAEFINKHKLSKEFSTTAQKYYVPLAEQILLTKKSATGVFFVGVNGCQGSGKSTLTDFLSDYLQQQYKLTVVALSLDDFYYSQKKRQFLAKKIHPLLKTRGVPGTHDVDLLKNILLKLKSLTYPLLLPRFNKATDNPHSKMNWEKVNHKVDIVLMEGWCWGIKPQAGKELTNPVNALENNEDPNAIWRSYVNTQLRKHYTPLYSIMNYWVMLKAPSFDSVYSWRLQQEKKLALKIDKQPYRKGNQDLMQGLMNDAQILQFIQYFQRLTKCGLELPEECMDVVFLLNQDRQIFNTTGVHFTG